MSNDASPENFAKQKRAVIVAPAGYGKTELIVQSVACCNGRQLVLTHTHAGVDSLRKRFKKYSIPSSKFNIETIHSFALRFAGSYPKTTGLSFEKPQEDKEYDQVISSAINLFDIKLGKDILRSSYSGIFVDEYQDCQINQHYLICKLADFLPCRIVGDPLQGIYDFGNNRIIDWENHVNNFFDPLPDLKIPYRWNKTNSNLGERLKELRQIIENKETINFTDNIMPASHENIIKTLYGEIGGDDRIYVICSPKVEDIYFSHTLAKSMKNQYHTIEPLTSKDLCRHALNMESLKGDQKLKEIIDFAKKCLTGISEDCKRVIDYQRGYLSYRQNTLKQHFEKISQSDKLQQIYELFHFFEMEYNPTYIRKQLWAEMKKGLQEVIKGGYVCLEEAAWNVRNQSRFKENRIPKRCISRTVLLKGLECDHVMIIKPELFDAKNLYVALTRASSKLTIISDSQTWSNY